MRTCERFQVANRTRLCYNLPMNKWLIVLSVVSFFFIAAMMSFTSPSGVGPWGILLFFCLCYVMFLGLAVGACRIFFSLKERLRKTNGNIQRKSYYYGLVVALAPVLVLFMGSFGGIAIPELLMVLGVEVILCFFVAHSVL